MSASKILFFLCISFVAGIFLESLMKIPQILLWAFLLLDFFAIIIFLFLKRNILIIAGFCFLFLIIGVLRFQVSEFDIANDKLSKFIGRGQVVFTGTISDEPDVRDKSQKIKVQVGSSTTLVTTQKYPEYQYLDKIKITGRLEVPMVAEDFNYKDYLLKDHIYSVMNFPKIEVTGKSRGGLASTVYAGILFVKQKLEGTLQNNFLPPHSLILEGTIFGNNKNMTQELRDKLNSAGVRFLTAISGVHVVILSSILVSLLFFFGFSRKYATGFSIVLIWLYVALTGFSASGIRAAIMGSILILAEIFGRQNTSSRTIVLAAALMLLQNPLLLLYDVGFQLSFLASLGIIYLKPLIKAGLSILFKENAKKFIDIVSITFAAQIFTLPIMVYNFGTVSLVAPITNLLLLPAMPWILSFGFLFSIFAAISGFLAWIFYVPTWFLASYFLKVVDTFSQPWMARTFTNISWIWIFVSYFTIFSAVWFLNKKFAQKFV